MKSIPGYDGYFATHDGYIVSTRRYPNGRRLAGYINEDGYSTVTIVANDGVKRKTLVHRLIAAAYLGSQPEDATLARHLDGDKLNNRPENIAWGTELLNFHDAVRHGTRIINPSGNGEIMVEGKVAEVLAALARGISGNKVSRDLRVSRSQVSKLKNGKRWRHMTAA